MRCKSFAVRLLLTSTAAVLFCAGPAVRAQSKMSDAPASAPSRWAAELERIDDDLRLRLLTPSDARSNWIRASLDKTDIQSQVTHFAAARTEAPQESLYLASLAAACLQPTQPTLPECDQMDRLADWARRDEDNGVPSILLAERARQRREIDTMVAHLTEAASKPRFEEYWGRGVLAFWDYLRALPAGYDPAAKAVAAVGYGTAQQVLWPDAVQAMCVNTREVAVETVRAACAELGRALSQRGSSWTARYIGVAVEYRNAGDATARARVESTRTNLAAVRARCNDAMLSRFGGLESADPAVRARDLTFGDQWIRAQAQYGEVGACERMYGGGATRP
ncbi:MAG TPA: hypothetical protein VGI14_04000 [Casimicrobiaceae bacterium]|jgi:hypothetical protein